MGHYRRRSRQASMKARLSIAAAVLVGGGAIGAVAVATSNHSAPSAAQSAAYSSNASHQISVGNALSTALTTWSTWRPTALRALSHMAPMRTFATAQKGHTTFAAQRGVVLLANKHWLLVKSTNGSLHLWLINGATKVTNVVTNVAGLTAMTGAAPAVVTAAQHGNTAPAVQTMAGSTQAVAAMTAPVAKPTTITVSVPGTNEVITITISQATAAVTASGTMAAQQTSTAMTTTVQPVMMAATNHVARGDLVFVAGVMKHHQLVAQLVLFKAPAATPAPTPTPVASTGMPTVPPTTGVTPTTPVVTATPSQISGTHT